MTTELITDPGAEDANSYCSLDEANAYHDTHVLGSAWIAIDSQSHDQQIRALIHATRVLDQQMDWIGSKASATQALRWPRTGATDVDGQTIPSDEIPVDIVRATAEFARVLVTGSDPFVAVDSAASGIEEVQAGSVRVKFTQDSTPLVLPTSVSSLLAHYTTGTVSGGIEVPLVRV